MASLVPEIEAVSQWNHVKVLQNVSHWENQSLRIRCRTQLLNAAFSWSFLVSLMMLLTSTDFEFRFDRGTKIQKRLSCNLIRLALRPLSADRLHFHNTSMRSSYFAFYPIGVGDLCLADTDILSPWPNPTAVFSQSSALGFWVVPG